MKDYERLTIILPNGEVRINETKFSCSETNYNRVLNRLSELEDKIENGMLLEVPARLHFGCGISGIGWGSEGNEISFFSLKEKSKPLGTLDFENVKTTYFIAEFSNKEELYMFKKAINKVIKHAEDILKYKELKDD
jgi:hypothetical protein